MLKQGYAVNQEESKDPTWQQKNINGNSQEMAQLAVKLAQLHRLTIEQKLREMKAHVSMECAKLNHQAAKDFADEINKLEIK